MGKKSHDPFSYLAKYVAKQGGDLWLGGTLAGVNFSQFVKSRKPIGKREIVQSPNMPWQIFHMNYKRRKR